ncbi:Twin transmembrane helix small protein [Georgfuchsia toluolica]|uniref:Twin transmembrane helix small protein n=1 Tax=Georgfuchsia toluolica TaxID=424218 RepID=A0A916J7E7_9PROT|nr:twin transmembrane helix small protein [Georgfuchsia toluolica]CAG4883791.1 Twin transmembrane helix small protein [Georgfuchsia toluolica]
MVIKGLVLVLLLAVLASLFAGLFFLLRDGSHEKRTVRALTVRIVLSVLLFALIMIGFQSVLGVGR